MMSILLVAAQTANAWTHGPNYVVWNQADFPLVWYMSEYVEDSLPQDATYGDKGDLLYQEDTMIRGYNAWINGAQCAGLQAEYGGILPDTQDDGPSRSDAVNMVYFDDPTDSFGTGILAVTIPGVTGQRAFILNGEEYNYLLDQDIVFNEWVDWATTEDIEAGICAGESSVEAVATHEIGHLWGMGHSCEEDDVCSDTDLLLATMYWSAGQCSIHQTDVNDDDIDGMTALYGPFASFSSESDRRGGVPLDVAFTLSGNDQEVQDITWNFGDGESSTELEPTHTYNSKGQFSVSMDICGTTDECGEWCYTQRESSYVIACGAPEPGLNEEGEPFDSMFTAEHHDGLIYQLINQADTSVYGCIEEIGWYVYDGKSDTQVGDVVRSWSPKIEFPKEGSYTIAMHAKGPGGEIVEELYVEDVEDKIGEDFRGGACASTGASPVAAVGAFFGLALALGRRRRR